MYVLYFQFVSDVMFSHNDSYGPESKTMRMFCLVCQVAAPVGRQTTWFGLVCQGRLDEVCCLQLHFVASWSFHCYDIYALKRYFDNVGAFALLCESLTWLCIN